MKKKLMVAAIGVGIFTAGVFSGKQIQKVSHKRKTSYGGFIQLIHDSKNNVTPYMAVTVPPKDLVGLANVIFEVV